MRSHYAGPKDRGLWFRRAALVACLAGVISTAARTEPSFPAKPIHIFIPYGAGGVGDLTVRLLAQKLTERTKQQVVIENRPGAGGLLSAKGVLDAPPNGYTLGLFGNGQAISMSLFKSRPYNVLTDFSFVSITARFEMLLAVKADSPLKTLPDVVAAARKSPGRLNFGAVNPGSTQNLSAHLLKQVGELDVTIVPFKTTPDLITAILRGDVDVGFDFYAGFQSVIVDNKVRIVATSGEQRNPLLPDVPTAKEMGLDYEMSIWAGIFAPKGTPKDIVDKLARALDQALDDPGVKKRLADLGGSLPTKDERTPAKFDAFVKAEIARWSPILKAANTEAK